METTEHIIERISPAHYKDMQFLFEHCFHRKISTDIFKKKFDTTKLGIDHIGYFAYTKEGFPISSYGLYPCKISYHNKNYLAAISGDSMTHSDYRGKGWFDTLARKTYELGKESGIKFMYCFPNQFTLSGSKKLGWQYSEEEKLRTYSIKVATLPFAKLCRKNSMLNSLYKGYVNLVMKFYKSNDSFFQNSIQRQDFGGVIHDKDFFSYKVFSQNTILKINNTNVWVKVDGELKIGDIEKIEGNNLVDLIKKLKRVSFLLGCREIQTTISEESFIHQELKNDFPNSESFQVGRIDYGLDFPKEKIKFVMGDFDTY